MRRWRSVQVVRLLMPITIKILRVGNRWTFKASDSDDPVPQFSHSVDLFHWIEHRYELPRHAVIEAQQIIDKQLGVPFPIVAIKRLTLISRPK